jgi:hypothetical protein
VIGFGLGLPNESRADLTRKYSFAIPNPRALDFIASWGPIVEMGAGTGYWASLLKQMKADIIAYDNFEGHRSDTYGFGKVWTAIHKGAPPTLAKHPDRTLMLCWPDYNRPFASRCMKYYQGDRLIYIGEGRGGCTGNAHFHRLLDKEWEPEKSILIPHWPGIYDYLCAYQRKKTHGRRKRQ